MSNTKSYQFLTSAFADLWKNVLSSVFYILYASSVLAITHIYSLSLSVVSSVIDFLYNNTPVLFLTLLGSSMAKVFLFALYAVCGGLLLVVILAGVFFLGPGKFFLTLPACFALVLIVSFGLLVCFIDGIVNFCQHIRAMGRVGPSPRRPLIYSKTTFVSSRTRAQQPIREGLAILVWVLPSACAYLVSLSQEVLSASW